MGGPSTFPSGELFIPSNIIITFPGSYMGLGQLLAGYCDFRVFPLNCCYGWVNNLIKYLFYKNLLDGSLYHKYFI